MLTAFVKLIRTKCLLAPVSLMAVCQTAFAELTVNLYSCRRAIVTVRP